MQNVAGGRLPLRTRATCSAAATTSPTSTVAAVLQFQSRSGAVQRRLSRPGHLGCRRPRRRARRKRPRSTPLRRHREDDASGRSRPRRAPQVIRRKWRLLLHLHSCFKNVSRRSSEVESRSSSGLGMSDPNDQCHRYCSTTSPTSIPHAQRRTESTSSDSSGGEFSFGSLDSAENTMRNSSVGQGNTELPQVSKRIR